MANLTALPSYESGIAASLLVAREALMAPIRKHLRQHDITEQQWRLLRVLMDRGAMDTTAISKAAILLAPSVTRILKELEERGFVARDQDPDDARRSIVQITRAGQSLVKATAVDTLKEINAIYNAFGEKRIAQLIQELQAFAETIETLNEPAD